jgi:hypothetical protein
MGLRERLDRLEKSSGLHQVGDKRFLVIYPRDQEKPEAALRRECHKRKMQAEDVGHALILGDDMQIIDNLNHDGLHTLQGYRSFQQDVKRVLQEIDGSSTEPVLTR